ALGALLDLELHPVTFGQRAEALRRDRRVVHEHIRAAVLLDETEALRVVKPLHLALRHLRLLLRIGLYARCTPALVAGAYCQQKHCPEDCSGAVHASDEGTSASRLMPFGAHILQT